MEIKQIGILRELLSHPGETLKEVLESNNMTQKELAFRVDITEKHLTNIINGKAPITPEMALKLSKVFSLSSSFWNNLQANYDSELHKIEEYSKISEKEKQIVKESGYSQLSKFGYVESTRNIEEKVINMRNFWGISSLEKVSDLFTSSNSPIAAFRRSKTCAINPYAMASWLKICEIETDNIDVHGYNLDKLKEKLPLIKQLMFKQDPNIIVKELQQVFSECGIAFSVVRNLTGAPVQGLIKKIDNKIRLCVTLRGAHADIFWFTLFHEIGHLFTLPRDNWMVDYREPDKTCGDEKYEKVADAFANNQLISVNDYRRFVVNGNFSRQSILRFAREQNILPCIIVGRLKHDKYIPYTDYNDLVINYQWAN